MIRRILTPLDSSEYGEAALSAAIRLGKAQNAEITGLVVLDIPGISKSIGPIPMGASYYAKALEKDRVEIAEKKIKALLESFKNRCEESGVKYKAHFRQGVPSGKILEESLFFDILVVGMKTYYRFDSDDQPGDSFAELLDHSITPIIAAPKSFDFPDFPNEDFNALIAFDGSLPSCRALQRFAQLSFSESVNVRLVMSHDYKKFADHYLDDAEAFLRAHSFEKIEKVYTDENIINVISENHLEWADLAVLGAHSNKGIFDFMVGSLAKYLIKENKIPIFLGQ